MAKKGCANMLARVVGKGLRTCICLMLHYIKIPNLVP